MRGFRTNDPIERPSPLVGRKLTLYRDDSTVQVVFQSVKTFFWTANNTILTIAVYNVPGAPEHHYVHWPRERFCWFKDEPGVAP